MKKSTIKRQSYPQTPRERAIELVRVAFVAKKGGWDDPRKAILFAARLLIYEAQAIEGRTSPTLQDVRHMKGVLSHVSDSVVGEGLRR